MATLMLLMLTAYLIGGLVKLIQVGFVGEFNEAWAEAFNDRDLTILDVMALVVAMMFMLLWCWWLWPITLRGHQHDLPGTQPRP